MPNVTIDDGLYVGSSALDASAGIEIDSTALGFLPPRMTTTQRDAISSPATGLVIYNTTTSALNAYNGASWVAVGTGSGASAALDNLASVAINTSLISDTDGTDDLGSSSIRWKDVWADSIIGANEIEVYNNSAGTIATEQVVYISGFNVGADLPEITLADSDSAGAENGIGITQAAISSASSGRIVILGVATYPTTGMSVNDNLYIDTTAGGLTNTAPSSPTKPVIFGEVLKVGATGVGKILVEPSRRPRVVSADGTYTAGSHYTTTSTSYSDVDATNVKATVTLNGGGLVYVEFSFACDKSTAGNALFRITDGTNNSNDFTLNTGIGIVRMSIHWVVSLGAGSTTFKLQFKSSDANIARIYNINDTINWSAWEIS